MKREILPNHDAKYENLRVTQQFQVEEAFQFCCTFDPEARPTATQVLYLFRKKPDVPVETEQQSLTYATEFHGKQSQSIW